MKKIFTVISIVIAISIAFAGCGNSKNSFDQGNDFISTTAVPDSENQQITQQVTIQGYSLEQLSQMIVDTLKTKDVESAKKILFPNADNILAYLYKNYDEDSSVIIDCEMTNIQTFFDKNKEDGVSFGKNCEYTIRDLSKFSQSSGEEKEAFESLLNEVKDGVANTHTNIDVLDVASCYIRCVSNEFSAGVSAVAVQIDSGWLLLCLD